MENYQKLNTCNQDKQKVISNIKSTCNTLDKAEDILREKISLRKHELSTLKRDFNNMIETYTHIIRASVKKKK